MKRKNIILVNSLIVMGFVLILISSCMKEGDEPPPITPTTKVVTVKDADSNVYHTIGIGTQVWMVENLRVTKYHNGAPIPNVIDNAAWGNLTTGAYCDYENTPGNSTTYGKLYNWYAAQDTLLAPIGWHIATDAEWTTLTTYLCGASGAGGKLKEAGYVHWPVPNTEATNEVGFTALPGGFRGSNGAFNFIGKYGYWWSSTDSSASEAWNRSMYNDHCNVGRYLTVKSLGYSVRCVKDS